MDNIQYVNLVCPKIIIPILRNKKTISIDGNVELLCHKKDLFLTMEVCSSANNIQFESQPFKQGISSDSMSSPDEIKYATISTGQGLFPVSLLGDPASKQNSKVLLRALGRIKPHRDGLDPLPHI